MYELFIGTFVTFFVVIDPLGIAPIFAVMTDGASASFKRRMVLKATAIGGLILLFFAFLGTGLLSALGISMMALKTAGGILLFMIALEMIFEKRTERREKKSEGLAHDSIHDSGNDPKSGPESGPESSSESSPESNQKSGQKSGQKSDIALIESDANYDDISVFPIAIPFVSGPGSIATIMLLMSQHTGHADEQGLIIGALLLVLLSTILILLTASKIIGLLGHTVANAITRILGVILAALATQYVFDGIKGVFY